MMPMRRKSPLVCQLSKLLPAFCLFGFSLLLLAQGEWTSPNRIGLVQDWSTHHAVFPGNGPLSAMLAAQHDPRAFYSWRVAALDAVRTTSTSAAQTETAVDERHRANLRMSNRDWSISLGSAGTAGAMYPAKFTFDINATPSCANDFVVFPANQSPNATHENLVAFNNLYSGNVNSFGICNRTTSASDNGLAATVKWSYAVSSSIAAGDSTSPALSLNGTKVAFVESKSGSQPHFHVLAWKNGDGVNASNKQDAQSPKVLSTFTASAPVAGSGDRKSTRLNSSHVRISYAVFCLKKKKHIYAPDKAHEVDVPLLKHRLKAGEVAFSFINIRVVRLFACLPRLEREAVINCQMLNSI